MPELVSARVPRFEVILNHAMALPGIKISRAAFLRKELAKHFSEETVERAIELNPAQAGLDVEKLSKIAKACINNETYKVTALSAAAGLPGGVAMAATVPADVVQFFGHIIRILQKLAYLYGWPEMLRKDDDGFDDETTNELILFIGVMFGVNTANNAIAKIATSVALKTERSLAQKALTKGTIYPIVKQVSRAIGVRMTKEIFASGVGRAIPIVGAGVSGGITFAMFKPMSKRLQKYLTTLPMASVEFYQDSLDYQMRNSDSYNDEVDLADTNEKP
jgi:hypothetical protein